jgi:hypothetical protein
MQIFRGPVFLIAAAAAVLLLAGLTAMGQQKRQYILASAMGTSTQMGQLVDVKIIIDAYSTADDRAILVQAFQEKGSEGLCNALGKMHAVGRIAISGTLGFDVNFIRTINMPDGTKHIRFVTDRPITFGEAWSGSNSMDYNLSLGEIIVSPKKGKNTGTIVPAAQLKIDKDNEIGVEAYQNPWKLVNIMIK